MKQNPQTVERTTSTDGASEGVRKPLLALIGLILLACAGGAFFLAHRDKAGPQPPVQPDGAPGQAQTSDPKVPSGAEEPKAVETTGTAPGTPTAPTQVTVPLGKRHATTPEPATAKGPEPSPYTRQLVNGLTQLDLSKGPMTPEKAAMYKTTLQQLASQGTEAVPAIREFLEKNLDLTFDGATANLTGQPSVRLSMLEALQNIGGAEAMSLSSQILQTTLDPREIAWLAQSLEQQAPGEYTQMAIDAAREALAMANTGQLEGRDVGPLFGVLQRYGGTDAVDELQRASPLYRYYSTIALANMPEGAGISALVQMVQDPEALSKGGRAPALQMLAQVALQSQEARQALIEQAKMNQIPSSTWINIASILSGDRMLIGTAPVESGVRSFHLSSGNQNFYTMPDRTPWPPEQVNQYLNLIDQLAAVNNNPTAVAALQKARADLQARLQQQ